jgi:hypothetical protein
MPARGQARSDRVRSIEAAVVRAAAAGEPNLDVGTLRRYRAAGSRQLIVATRDRMVADGVVAIPPESGSGPLPVPERLRPKEPEPEPGPLDADIRAALATRRLTAWAEGLCSDIAAAAASFVERGELPRKGEAWKRAVAEQSRRRRGGSATVA